MTNGFEAYKQYLAVKQHFTQKGYDYFKYNGKVNAKETSYDVRKDKYQFHRLSKTPDLTNYMVSNFIDRDIKWVGDLLDHKAEATYTAWLNKQQSIAYNFKNELEKLLTSFDNNIIVSNGQHPHLLKMYNKKEISIETIIILDDILNFTPYWDKNIIDTVIWPLIRLKLQKYKPFVKYDLEKMQKIYDQYRENV